MAYDNERKKYSKIPFQYVEVEVDAVITRFYDYNYGEVISGFDGYPALKSFSMSPAKIDISGGVGMRATAQASIGEVMDYTVNGTLTSPVRYWAAWTAKNRNYRYQRVSHFSGYIVSGVYDSTNFIQRDFVIENMSWGPDGVSFSLRDPLMLANDDKAKLPLESKGKLSADVLAAATTINLLPAGIGNTEYPASNFYVRINDEIMLCTTRTADALTVTRGQRGSIAEDQSQDDTVQLCLWLEDETISNIGYHLLTVGANVATSYINKPLWDSRNSDAFPNVYELFVTKPTGIRKLLKEIGDSAPHYYYYDTRSNQIQFKPQEAPQNTGQVLTFDANLLIGKTVVTDRKDLQVTTVVIYFDIRNPVKDLEEASNFRQIYVREDTAAVLANGGSRVYKTVYSRLILAGNKSAAVLAASLTGRRFAIPPFQINYELDPKDGEVWTGDAVRIESDLVLNPSTLAPDLRTYQITSANEDTNSQRFKYTALEHSYGAAVSGDEDVEDPNTRLVYISGENDQLRDPITNTVQTLRDIYETAYGATVLSAYDVRFIIEVGAVAGSSDNTAYAIRTGTWPELSTPPMIVNYNLIVGKGGNGANVGGSPEAGGPALILEDDIRLNNLGVIGGGGGGGAADVGFGTDTAQAGGGGGAGFINGNLGDGTIAEGISPFFRIAENGTNTAGGRGGNANNNSFPEPNFAVGGNGGALGAVGGGGGGAAGVAINLNGFTITYIETGTISGAITA